MSVNHDNEKADHFLVKAAIILADEPGPTPELLDAVASPTVDAIGTKGMAPCEGSGGERAFARGPLLALHPLHV